MRSKIRKQQDKYMMRKTQNPFSLSSSLQSIYFHWSTCPPHCQSWWSSGSQGYDIGGDHAWWVHLHLSDQVFFLSLKSPSVKIDGDRIHCSAFRDLLLSCNHQISRVNLQVQVVHYSSLLLHKVDKSALADAIWKNCESGVPADFRIQYIYICSGWWNTSTMHLMASQLGDIYRSGGDG